MFDIQHADTQTFELALDCLVYVAVFGPILIRKRGVGPVLAQNCPVAVSAAVLIIGPDKLPHGRTLKEAKNEKKILF